MKRTIFIVFLLLVLTIAMSSQDVTKLPSRYPNDFIMRNDAAMKDINKAYLEKKSYAYAGAIKRLTAEADAAFKKGPFSVMYKKSTPKSGDKHDYISIGIYWWPDPSKPNGLPYIRHDGEVNPETKNDTFDKNSLVQFTASVLDLTSAYVITGERSYANYAAELIKVCFLYPETKMNPNLNFGQAVPGINDGRKEGIIESVNFVGVIEAAKILNKNSILKDADYANLKKWFKEYLKWLMESKIGQEEFNATNNHGTWFAVQAVQYAKFTGQNALAKKILGDIVPSRIASQVTSDGKLPEELARAIPLHYSIYALTAFMILSKMAEEIGIDYWNFKTADGKSIKIALDYILPYIEGSKKLTVNGKEPVEKMSAQIFFVSFLRYAAVKYKDKKYEECADALLERAYSEEADKFLGFKKDSDRENLLFPESFNK
jgi:hypothetical protein